MNIEQKLRKSRKKALAGYIAFGCAIIYLLMTLVKSTHAATHNVAFPLIDAIHIVTVQIIDVTSVFPLNYLWKITPEMGFAKTGVVGLYKILIPPIIIFTVAGLYIADYQALHVRYFDLRAKINEEVELKRMRSAQGLETVAESANIEIMIRNATDNEPYWYEKWWGQIAIGVAIVLIVSLIGLN